MKIIKTWHDFQVVTPTRFLHYVIDLYEYDPITNKSAIGYAFYFQASRYEPAVQSGYSSYGTGDFDFLLDSGVVPDSGMTKCANPFSDVDNDYDDFYYVMDTNYPFHMVNGRYIRDIDNCELLYVDHDQFNRKIMSGDYHADFRIAYDDSYNFWVSGTTMKISIDLQDRGTTEPFLAKGGSGLTDESDFAATIYTHSMKPIEKYEISLRHFYGENDLQSDTITTVELPSAVSTAYSFNLTEAQRDQIRAAVPNDTETTIQYVLVTYHTDGSIYRYYGYPFTIEIANSYPIINNLVIEEANDDVFALTGDRNLFVKYKSSAEVSFEPVARKYATIESITIKCGEQVVTDMPQGYFDDVESGTFEITIVDSRGMATSTTVVKELVPYVQLTCYQNVGLELIEDDKVTANVKVYGSWFYGHFGTVANELVIEFRHTQNDGFLGDWVVLTDGLIPVFNGHTYELEFTVEGLTYMSNYDFQCRVKDKISGYVISQTNTTSIVPVYDWGKEDFNFNVPINMNEKTVLRHNKAAKNTVLSASGENIYFRPKGTDDTDGEAVLNRDGDFAVSGGLSVEGEITANGGLNITGDFTINGEAFPRDMDYVVEYGNENMGSNGTWHWTKWASGRVECYGTRNMGRLSIDNAVGSIYVSDPLDQYLPTGLFSTAPQTVVISLNDIGGIYGWIMRNPTSAANSNTYIEGIVVASPVSGITTQTNLSFYVAGY